MTAEVKRVGCRASVCVFIYVLRRKEERERESVCVSVCAFVVQTDCSRRLSHVPSRGRADENSRRSTQSGDITGNCPSWASSFAMLNKLAPVQSLEQKRIKLTL